MLEEEEEELDDETIQARVDASLAKIYSVTSTWLKPNKAPSAPKKDVEKELEEIMRRPPRLGVGAELPEKQVKSGPGELKLKNKMLGNKRRREETNSSGSTDVPTPEDDEAESKSNAIRKKPKLDPFASNKRKGKGLNIPATVLPHKLAGSSPAFETKDEGSPGPSSLRTTSVYEPNPGSDEAYREEEGKQLIVNVKDMARVHVSTLSLPPATLGLHDPPTTRNAAVSSPKKKRKKKKKKHHVGGVTAVIPQTSPN